MGISKNLPTHILMRLSGHTTERIFRSYFSTLKEELVEFASPLFDEVSNEDDKGVVKKKPSVFVGDTDGLDELKKLKSLYEGGFISKEMWDSKVNKILN